jgi:phosphoribosylaminoimidazole-succinocarboxamide synthase
VTATGGPIAGLADQHVHAGKVRDLYAIDDLLLLVASDRISAFDYVLPNVIPDKGVILTQLSLWWFDQLVGVVPTHVVTADVDAYPSALAPYADELRGRSMLCRRLDMVAVECVARGYLTGGGFQEYRESGAVCGVPLPPGLEDGSRLPAAIFTPTTKAPVGQHDESMTYDDVVTAVGAELAERLRAVTLAIYQRGAELAEKAGIILADTKVELGHDPAGGLTLGDEVLTPDSSRFWPAAQWHPGGQQPSFDKQYVRDWLLHDSGWDRASPPPPLPDDVIERTRSKYVEAYDRLTGRRFVSPG